MNAAEASGGGRGPGRHHIFFFLLDRHGLYRDCGSQAGRLPARHRKAYTPRFPPSATRTGGDGCCKAELHTQEGLAATNASKMNCRGNAAGVQKQ